MLRLYAKETRPKINDHEWLKRKGHLVDWKSLDRSDSVIFVFIGERFCAIFESGK